MDSELIEFISHLDDDVPFSPYHQLNEMWRELEDYFDRSYFDIDEYLDELLPSAQPVSSTLEYNIPSDEPALMTEDKLFQSFAIPERFFNDLIVDRPVLKDQNVVTTEILLSAVRSQKYSYSGRKYEHPFKDCVSGRVNSAASLRNDFIADSGTTLTPSMSSNRAWFSALHKQELQPGTTAEEMVKNIMRDKSVILPPQTEMLKVIEALFTDLNSYIEHLSAEFADHKFFDTPQFDGIAQKLQQKMLSLSNRKEKSLRDVLLHWMEMVTKSFAHVNDQRREIEVKVSEKIINDAVEIYHGRLMLSKLNEENKSILYKKESDIICQGIRHAYANCGEAFIASVVRQLERRLNNDSLTTNEVSISHVNSTVSDEYQILIDLLVSEYASNIIQKGLQCAGISTLEQFDDVNGTCLKDIWYDFDRKTKDVPFAETNGLKKELSSKLDSESNSKRSEFKKRLLAASAPSTVSCTSSLTKSVGIHFGFEEITVSYYDRVVNSFRTIYGPIANVVSFTSDDGISIGLIKSDTFSLNMENALKTLSVDQLYDTRHYGQMKIGSIIALMLMYIDEMAKQKLHTTSKIQYTMAIPSCLNDIIQGTFKTAIKIADIDCRLIQEQSALTANFVREHHQAMKRNEDEFVVAMVVNEKNSCDSVVYGISENMKMKVLSASGSDDNRRFVGFVGDSGVKHELDRIQSKCNMRNRFLICCTSDQEICKQIKNQFNKSKVHPLKLDSRKLAEGAAFLSYVAVDGCCLECPFDLLNLTSIKQFCSGVSYRLVHTTSNSKMQNLQELAIQLRSLMDNQLMELSESKAATKQMIVGKMKDLEESRLTRQKKEKFRRLLKNDLKAVDEELMNKSVIENVAENWRKNQFLE